MARLMSEEIHPLVKLLCEDRRYKLEAYQFVRAGLSYAQDVMGMGASVPGEMAAEVEETAPSEEESAEDDLELVADAPSQRPLRHVTGQDLSRALRAFALDQYGRMAKLVLNSWGVNSTSDFGEIVYNLIMVGEMTKSEHDRREDFDNVYEFEQALVRDFEITRPVATTAKGS